MPKGAGDEYWEQQRLPSVFKHDLLSRYLPIFAGKTGSRAPGVVYLDGYAGRGRYEDGTPGSAERILQIAENQRALGSTTVSSSTNRTRNPTPSSSRGGRVRRARRPSRGFPQRGHQRSQRGHRRGRAFAAVPVPRPMRAGHPILRSWRDTLTGPRAVKWPPTEVLLNFSLEAVRRIAGHVTSATPNEKTMARLDEALGGDWWRSLVVRGVTDHAVNQIVTGFMERLADAAKMDIFVMPVRRAPSHKPIYGLVPPGPAQRA